jgi:hypothetical protein
MKKRWISRVRMALAVVRAKATGRRWFVEWDGDVWQVIED